MVEASLKGWLLWALLQHLVSPSVCVTPGGGLLGNREGGPGLWGASF